MASILPLISVFLVISLMMFVMSSSLGIGDVEKTVDYRPGGLWD